MSNQGLFIYRRILSKPSSDPTATRGQSSVELLVTQAPEASSSSSQCEPGGRNLAANHKGDNPHFSATTVHLICTNLISMRMNNQEHLCSHPVVDRTLPAQRYC